MDCGGSHGQLQRRGGIPNRSNVRSGWRANCRGAAVMLTVRAVAWRIMPIAKVAQCCEHSRESPGLSLRPVFIKGVFTNPVQAPIAQCPRAGRRRCSAQALVSARSVTANRVSMLTLTSPEGRELALDDDKAARMRNGRGYRDCRRSPDPVTVDATMASGGAVCRVCPALHSRPLAMNHSQLGNTRVMCLQHSTRKQGATRLTHRAAMISYYCQPGVSPRGLRLDTLISVPSSGAEEDHDKSAKDS